MTQPDYLKAALAPFNNHFGYFKQLQYLDSLSSFCGYEYIYRSQISGKIADAIAFFQVPFMLDKMQKLREANDVASRTQASLNVISQAVKVAKFAQRIFMVAAFNRYKVAMTLIQASSDIITSAMECKKIWSGIDGSDSPGQLKAKQYALARAASVIGLSALELLAQAAIQLSGFGTLQMALLTTLTASGYMAEFQKSINEQTKS